MKWRNDMSKVTTSLNKRFAEGMAAMGNRGSVELSEFTDDISEARISVKVAFRSDESLQPLSAQRQSGGERAVSTMLFLLAMQVRACLARALLRSSNSPDGHCRG